MSEKPNLGDDLRALFADVTPNPGAVESGIAAGRALMRRRRRARMLAAAGVVSCVTGAVLITGPADRPDRVIDPAPPTSETLDQACVKALQSGTPPDSMPAMAAVLGRESSLSARVVSTDDLADGARLCTNTGAGPTIIELPAPLPADELGTENFALLRLAPTTYLIAFGVNEQPLDGGISVSAPGVSQGVPIARGGKYVLALLATDHPVDPAGSDSVQVTLQVKGRENPYGFTIYPENFVAPGSGKLNGPTNANHLENPAACDCGH